MEWKMKAQNQHWKSFGGQETHARVTHATIEVQIQENNG